MQSPSPFTCLSFTSPLSTANTPPGKKPVYSALRLASPSTSISVPSFQFCSCRLVFCCCQKNGLTIEEFSSMPGSWHVSISCSSFLHFCNCKAGKVREKKPFFTENLLIIHKYC